jgi:hypothetical protein
MPLLEVQRVTGKIRQFRSTNSTLTFYTNSNRHQDQMINKMADQEVCFLSLATTRTVTPLRPALAPPEQMTQLTRLVTA